MLLSHYEFFKSQKISYESHGVFFIHFIHSSILCINWHLVINNTELDKSHEQSSSGQSQFAPVRAWISKALITLAWLNTVRGMAVSDYIIRRSEMWIQYSCEARLYWPWWPTGFLGPVDWSGLVQSVPGAEWAAERSTEPGKPTGSSRSQRTAASLLLENKARTRAEKETCCVQLLGFQTSSYLTQRTMLDLALKNKDIEKKILTQSKGKFLLRPWRPFAW